MNRTIKFRGKSLVDIGNIKKVTGYMVVLLIMTIGFG